jgi:hypothetical protein
VNPVSTPRDTEVTMDINIAQWLPQPQYIRLYIDGASLRSSIALSYVDETGNSIAGSILVDDTVRDQLELSVQETVLTAQQLVSACGDITMRHVTLIDEEKDQSMSSSLIRDLTSRCYGGAVGRSGVGQSQYPWPYSSDSQYRSRATSGSFTGYYFADISGFSAPLLDNIPSTNGTWRLSITNLIQTELPMIYQWGITIVSAGCPFGMYGWNFGSCVACPVGMTTTDHFADDISSCTCTVDGFIWDESTLECIGTFPPNFSRFYPHLECFASFFFFCLRCNTTNDHMSIGY